MPKLIDLTGQKFGNLTVISRADNFGKHTMWNCRCICGNEKSYFASNLVRGISKSCGCMKKKYLKDTRIEDLGGKRFGRWTVLEFIEIRQHNAYWRCCCDCGNEGIIAAHALKRGSTQSCGCLMIEQFKEKRIGNEYSIDKNNVVHVTLRTGEEMICDLDDWDRLKRYTWTNDNHGYAIAKGDKRKIKFHIEVKGRKRGYVVDHQDRNKLNNRKSNLRFLTKSENAINSHVRKDNTSGITGVGMNNRKNRWVARIVVNQRNIHLGTFKSKEEAIKARKDAEEKYFKGILKN